MEFKLRPSGLLWPKLFVAAGGLFLGFYHFFSPEPSSGILLYNYIVYFLLGLLTALQSCKEVYFLFSNKTVLSINENSIHDYYNDVVYNWSDIEAIRQKNGYLYIKLYHPENYLNRIGNWHYRLIKKLWCKPGGKHNEFLVNISLADADKGEMTALLQEYSANKKLANGI